MLKILAEEHALGYNAAQIHVVKFINVEGSQKLMMHNSTQLNSTQHNECSISNLPIH